jgi:hypothetical protein
MWFWPPRNVRRNDQHASGFTTSYSGVHFRSQAIRFESQQSRRPSAAMQDKIIERLRDLNAYCHEIGDPKSTAASPPRTAFRNEGKQETLAEWHRRATGQRRTWRWRDGRAFATNCLLARRLISARVRR